MLVFGQVFLHKFAQILVENGTFFLNYVRSKDVPNKYEPYMHVLKNGFSFLNFVPEYSPASYL